MRDIELNKNDPEGDCDVAWVDDEDYEALSKFYWAARFNKKTLLYTVARSGINPETGRPTTVSMKHEILKPGPGYFIEHRNKNPFDNTRDNLRLVPRKATLEEEST